MYTFDATLATQAAMALAQYRERLAQAENERRARRAEAAAREQAAMERSGRLATWLAWITTYGTMSIR